METKVTLQNNSELYLNNEEVFLRSIPAKLKVGNLTTDALRLLVYYVTKASPYELAVESGNFDGTLKEWLLSLQANLAFKATVNTYNDLATVTGLQIGDLAYVMSTGRVYPYSGTGFPLEVNGLDITGDSAYDLAKKAGFVGTEAEWLNSLKLKFDDLTSEEIALLEGAVGPQGKSAYDLYVQELPLGEVPHSLTAWILSLKGETGKDGTDGTDGIDGVGKSAYESAKELDPLVGTEAEWLLTLKGKDGTNGTNGSRGDDGVNGKSAYDVAFEENPLVGTKPEWLLTLKGEPGVKGDDGVTQDATTIVLTDLATDTATPVEAVDTLLLAIGKLQAQITALEARIVLLETV